MTRAAMLFALVMLAISVEQSLSLRSMFPKNIKPVLRNGVDPGEPLYLTPYIKSGNLNEAQTASAVVLPGYQYKSYSGFITVNETTDSNMFFWFFPAKNNPTTAPVVLWLQGGPGGSSLFGLFNEHGPILINSNGELEERKINWNEKYSMLYVDNPVGTGFSYTGKDAGYAKNEVDVARDLYSMLSQFFTIFYQYQKNDFYATGESYAGKYVPAISYKIHTENPSATLKINLKGLAIGDGLCDPETMMAQYANLMFQIGMLDEKQRDYFSAESQKAVKLIQQKKFYDAFVIFDMLLNGDLYPYAPYFQNVSGTHNYYNFLMTQEPAAFGYYNNYLMRPEIRRAIHVGNLTYNDGQAVEQHIVNDIMDSVKPWVEVLLDNYKVLMYSGQLDIIVGVPLTEAFLMSTKWSGSDAYAQADRLVWKINPQDAEVAGYVRQVKQFYQVIVRNAGHILPYDQPERGWDMIQRFIENRSFV